MNTIPIKRALISVSNKAGIVDFATSLVAHGVEIISTGGTSEILKQAGIPHKPVEEVTGLPAMLDGRVKTLHPNIHGGILGRRDRHADEMAKHQIGGIDLVVVNFYPFSDAMLQHPNMTWDEAVEYIDVGGPAMVRAAAKNFSWVAAVVNPDDYVSIIEELHQLAGLSFATRKQLAEKVFAETAAYDASIHHYLSGRTLVEMEEYPEHINLHLDKCMELRYGENPHQKACAYQLKEDRSGILSALQHQGKPLSYNNILDAEAALTCVNEFSNPACVIVKHANPCGVACADDIESAFEKAYQTDPLSAFGGIIALNRPCTADIARAIETIFMEVVIAPAYTKEALAVLTVKPNMRVLELREQGGNGWEMKFITGGLLLQEKDPQNIHYDDLQIVTHTMPKKEEIDAMLFAWRVLKHVKSNGILIAKNNVTIGIGAGQVSRIDAVDLAVRKAGEHIQHAVLASDAFFPFRDSIDRLANTGIRAIIQPGGSVRDEEVIAACNQHGIAMAFTGKRCFRH